MPESKGTLGDRQDALKKKFSTLKEHKLKYTNKKYLGKKLKQNQKKFYS